MSTEAREDPVPALTEWAARVGPALGLGEAVSAEMVDRLLSLAGRSAHAVMRPAAPITTFLAGLALGADPTLDLAEVDRRITALLPP